MYAYVYVVGDMRQESRSEGEGKERKRQKEAVKKKKIALHEGKRTEEDRFQTGFLVSPHHSTLPPSPTPQISLETSVFFHTICHFLN